MTPAYRDKTLVTFWGTRGSISTPGRTTEKYGGNTPCVTVRHQDVIIILDAGTGIRNLGLDLSEEFRETGNPLLLHLFLSHTHWDHIQGLPFFEPAYNKDIKLRIYGSPKKGCFLGSILKGQMDYDYFPVAMSAFGADISIQEISDEVIHLGPVVVDRQEQVCHPGGSVRYRLRVDGKKIVYATDVELDSIFGGQDGDEADETLARDYLDFINDADLLIADAQYTEEEYPGKVEWGHSSVPMVLDIAARSRVKRLAMFHHDPQHTDKFLDALWVKNRPGHESGMEIFWAREGLTLAI
jgi:phosphoribosyl 1,2-cyclic phosphodiesterase